MLKLACGNTFCGAQIQWVSGHLPDAEFVAFLRRCRAGLRKGGAIVVKENLVAGQHFIMDKEDSSVSRSEPYFLRLFQEAGLELVDEREQKNFPKNLFKVKSYALR